MMTKKVSVPISFSRTLAAGDVLHRRVNQKSIDESLQFEASQFIRMRMVCLDAVNPHAPQRRAQSGDRDILAGLIERVISARKAILDMPIRNQ